MSLAETDEFKTIQTELDIIRHKLITLNERDYFRNPQMQAILDRYIGEISNLKLSLIRMSESETTEK